MSFTFAFLALILPMICSVVIAKTRNRNITKAMFVTLFLGWIATIGMWLCLKRRDPVTKQLY